MHAHGLYYKVFLAVFGAFLTVCFCHYISWQYIIRRSLFQSKWPILRTVNSSWETQHWRCIKNYKVNYNNCFWAEKNVYWAQFINVQVTFIYLIWIVLNAPLFPRLTSLVLCSKHQGPLFFSIKVMNHVDCFTSLTIAIVYCRWTTKGTEIHDHAVNLFINNEANGIHWHF